MPGKGLHEQPCSNFDNMDLSSFLFQDTYMYWHYMVQNKNQNRISHMHSTNWYSSVRDVAHTALASFRIVGQG
jgi:hypothetical protein